MDFTEGLGVGAVSLLIFAIRACDVSLGTLRTISVVNGRLGLSMVLGFVEILLWVTAVSHVILRVREDPIVAVAYAGGFAAGNALGILLERKLAIGRAVVRIISKNGLEIAESLSSKTNVLGVFPSELEGAPARLVFLTMKRKELRQAISIARAIDPELVYVVERFSEMSQFSPLPNATGWRAVLKKK